MKGNKRLIFIVNYRYRNVKVVPLFAVNKCNVSCLHRQRGATGTEYAHRYGDMVGCCGKAIKFSASSKRRNLDLAAKSRAADPTAGVAQRNVRLYFH
jgi:hypothetical protein